MISTIRFGTFLRTQHISLAYSSYDVFRSKLFQDLVLQCSPTNSWFIRFMRSEIGYWIGKILSQRITVPENGKDYLILNKGVRSVMFEYENNTPYRVWRRSDTDNWISEEFIGYQLIAEYSLDEFNKKQESIKCILKDHWKSVQQNAENGHGDLTHFNVLLSGNGFVLIDQKQPQPSLLFDFYYFVFYLKQCLKKSKTLSKDDRDLILKNLKQMVNETCTYSSLSELHADLEKIDTSAATGIAEKNRLSYLEEFKRIFAKTSTDSNADQYELT